MMSNAITTAPQSVEAVLEAVRAKYGALPDPEAMLSNQLRYLEFAFGSLEAVRGKRILDIGCGGVVGTIEIQSTRQWRTFEPWLLRSVVLLGGEGVGVDMARSGKEDFVILKRDLRRPDALEELVSGSFDGINCRLLFSSPHLASMTTQPEREVMRDRILLEVQRLRAPDGKIIDFDHNCRAD